jgi:hypothetical protein
MSFLEELLNELLEYPDNRDDDIVPELKYDCLKTNKRMFGDRLQVFKHGFIFNECGTKVIDFNYHSTLFRVALYFNKLRFSVVFGIFKTKPYFKLKFRKLVLPDYYTSYCNFFSLSMI